MAMYVLFTLNNLIKGITHKLPAMCTSIPLSFTKENFKKAEVAIKIIEQIVHYYIQYMIKILSLKGNKFTIKKMWPLKTPNNVTHKTFFIIFS